MLGQIPFATSFFSHVKQQGREKPLGSGLLAGPSGQRALRMGFYSPFPTSFKPCMLQARGLMKYCHLDDSGKMIWLYSPWVSQAMQLWHLLWRMNHTCRSRQPFRCVKGTQRWAFSLKNCLPTKPFICSITHSLPLVSKGQIFWWGYLGMYS